MEPLEDENSIEEDFDEKLKLMILGDSEVGKSSVLRKYCKNEFMSKYISTIGIDFQLKYINVNNKKIRLQVWDTAGQERYKVVAKNYFNTSDGFIVMYDITNRESFVNINNWMEQITTLGGNDVKYIIFGNKNDLSEKREVEIDEGKELAKKYKCKFFETSAKEGNNVEAGFKSITMDILGDFKAVQARRHDSAILKNHNIKKIHKKKTCCE